MKILENKPFFGGLSVKIIYNSRLGRFYQKRMARKSKQSHYENDIVFDYISGDKKQNLISGFNFFNCPINNFYTKQGMQNLMPYFCLTDYAVADFLNIGFKRSKTLSMGSDHCNHRYYKDIILPKGWHTEKFEDYREWNKESKNL